MLRLWLLIIISINGLTVPRHGMASNGIEKGSLDLSLVPDTRFEQKLSLSGDWVFYPERFITAADIDRLDTLKSVNLSVPALWSRSLFKSHPEWEGKLHFGSYMLRIEGLSSSQHALGLDSSLSVFSSKILWIRRDLSAWKVDSLNLGQAGETKDEERPWLLDPLMRLARDSNDGIYYLVYHVSSWQTTDGGIFVAPRLLDYEEAKTLRTLRFYQRYFFLGSFLMAFFVYIMFFLNRSKDRASFWLSLVCILAGVRLLSTENMLEPWFDFEKDKWVFASNILVRNAALPVGASAFLNFCFWSFPGSIKKWQQLCFGR